MEGDDNPIERMRRQIEGGGAAGEGAPNPDEAFPDLLGEGGFEPEPMEPSEFFDAVADRDRPDTSSAFHVRCAEIAYGSELSAAQEVVDAHGQRVGGEIMGALLGVEDEDRDGIDEVIRAGTERVVHFAGRVVYHACEAAVRYGVTGDDVEPLLFGDDSDAETFVRYVDDGDGRVAILEPDSDDIMCRMRASESFMRHDHGVEDLGEDMARYVAAVTCASFMLKAYQHMLELGCDIGRWHAIWADDVDPTDRVHSCEVGVDRGV